MGASLGELKYASDLVAFIREQTGDHFHLEVAAYPEMHPQAQSMNADLQAFKTKVEAGASSAITQYFFNVDAYKFFIDSCEKMGAGFTHHARYYAHHELRKSDAFFQHLRR